MIQMLVNAPVDFKKLSDVVNNEAIRKKFNKVNSKKKQQ